MSDYKTLGLELIGFRLRIYPWDDTNNVLVVGFDLPDPQNPKEPQQPPCWWAFCRNDEISISNTVHIQALRTWRWCQKSYLLSKLKWKVMHFLHHHAWEFSFEHRLKWFPFNQWLWKKECDYKLDLDNFAKLP